MYQYGANCKLYQLLVAMWCSGYHYCTTSSKKAWTQVFYLFILFSLCLQLTQNYSFAHKKSLYSLHSNNMELIDITLSLKKRWNLSQKNFLNQCEKTGSMLVQNLLSCKIYCHCLYC